MTVNDDSNNFKTSFERVGELVSIFQRGDKWYANFQHGGRQQRRSLKTTSKKEARNRALAIERDLVVGEYQADRRGPSIKSVVEAYYSVKRAQGRSKKTFAKYEFCFNRLIELAERLRVRSAAEIDLRLVDIYRRERADGGAGLSTIFKDVVLIRQLVIFAKKRRLIRVDPLVGLELEKPKPRRQPCWTRAQVEQILAAAEPPYLDALHLLADSGMRVGELEHLTWEDIDFANGVIRIRPKEGWKPKTGDERAIPMSPAARAMLEARPRNTQWVFTARVTERHPEPGRRVSERRLLAYLKRLLKPLELVGHLHTFRHSFISDALMKGIPVPMVRSWVGQVDPKTIELYTHVFDQDSQAAMQRLRSSATNPLQAKEQADENESSETARDTSSSQDSQTSGGAQKTDVANPAQNQHISEEDKTPRGAKQRPSTGWVDGLT